MKAKQKKSALLQQESLFDTATVSNANVYVGELEYPYRGMIMSHMASPDLDELHKMADAIGIQRKWFQNKGDDEKYPHYDICKSKKRLAIKLGAIEINDRELLKVCYPKIFL